MILDLALTTTPRRYQVRTTTAAQVGTMKFANEVLYVVEQQVLARHATGYVWQFDVLHTAQKATDLFSRLSADLNLASRRLVVQTDLHGQQLEVQNQAAVQQAWQQQRREVRARYAAEPAVRPLLDAFEQQLGVPGSLDAQLRNKGIYGALLPAIWGYEVSDKQAHLSRRCIAGFFQPHDLPLVVATTAAAAPPDQHPTEAVLVQATATLDEEAFAQTEFRRLIRSIVDDYTLPTALTLECHDQHLVAPRTGELLRSRQQLLAEVPGAYHNSILHEVFPQPTA